MNTILFIRRTLIAALVFTTPLTALPQNGWSMLAPAQSSSQSAFSEARRTEDLKMIQTALESKVLRQRLQEFGYSKTEVDQRLTRLSDSQIHQLAKQSEKMHPAGDAGLGILVSLLVIGILVLLFVFLFRRV